MRQFVWLLFFAVICLGAPPVFGQDPAEPPASPEADEEKPDAQADPAEPAEPDSDQPAEPAEKPEGEPAQENPDGEPADKPEGEPADEKPAGQTEEKPAEEKPEAQRQPKPEEAQPEPEQPMLVPTAPVEPTIPVGFAPIDYNLPQKDPTWQHYAIWAPLDVLAINFTFWQLSAITGESFGNISARQIEKNIVEGWFFDDNQFEVNQFAHPYQGGLYYLAARVNNMTYWESLGYTVLGSVQWELFMETESPAVNDLWMTTFGGWYMGEVMYRLSNLLLDNSDTGGSRVWRELGAGFLAPIHGLDRLYTGEAFDAGAPPKPVDTEVQLRFGAVGIPLNEAVKEDFQPTWMALFRLEYGDHFEKSKTKTPYDQFDFEGGLLWKLREELVAGAQFDGSGTLYGWRLGEGQNHFFGFMQSFEFFTNGTAKIFTPQDPDGVFQLGQTSVGPEYRWRVGFSKKLSLDLHARLMFMPLGAMTSPAAVPAVNRIYNYGTGATARLQLKLKHEDWGYLLAEARRYSMFVVNGADGFENAGMMNAQLFLDIHDGHGLLLQGLFWDRESIYDDFDDINDTLASGRVMYMKVWD